MKVGTYHTENAFVICIEFEGITCIPSGIASPFASILRATYAYISDENQDVSQQKCTKCRKCPCSKTQYAGKSQRKSRDASERIPYAET
eukprot:2598410-Rhodomonas_salina.1